jgi:hypothetical protein
MKYRTFRNIAVSGLLIAGGTVAAVGAMKFKEADPAPEPTPSDEELKAVIRQLIPPTPAAATTQSDTGSGTTGDAAGLRPVDRAALELLARPVTEARIKDGTRGKPYKVSVYSDDRKRWNRLKIDLERDETWDESWTIHADGAVERRAPADGPNRQIFRLVGKTSWRQEGAPERAPAAATASSAPPASAPGTAADGLRDIDRAALALVARPVNDSKIKDGTPGQPYKINVYSDDGKRWNRLKIDVERDETWDESWTLHPDGSIERRASSGGDERVYQLLDKKAWQERPARNRK